MHVTIENKAIESMVESLAYCAAALTQDIDNALRISNAAVRSSDMDTATEMNKQIVNLTRHRSNVRALMRAIV